MNSITSISNLIFYKTEKYQYNIRNVFDVSACPRPHYCLGLIIKGKATFTDCSTNNEISVSAGDIIFVPMGSRYVSSWSGTPEIEYISIHFIFAMHSLFAKDNNYMLQSVRIDNFEKYKQMFEYSLINNNGSNENKLTVLSNFFCILADIFPRLKKHTHTSLNPKIIKVLEFIEQNYNQKINVDDLAEKAQMSVSRFYPYFKRELGITPIDYINNYRISRAILLLIDNKGESIENISELTGFESSAYFRRVFRRITGVSPREYKKTSMEL